MTAIKKTNTKSKSSPAPAIKSAAASKLASVSKPVAKPVTKSVAKPVLKSASKTVAAKKPATSKAATGTNGHAPVSAKAIIATPVNTTVVAKIDVGFGNALYIRGAGPGLSWENGVLMSCVGDDVWQATLSESARGYTVKFLINDATWSVGPDFSFASGQSVTFSPAF